MLCSNYNLLLSYSYIDANKLWHKMCVANIEIIDVSMYLNNVCMHESTKLVIMISYGWFDNAAVSGHLSPVWSASWHCTTSFSSCDFATLLLKNIKIVITSCQHVGRRSLLFVEDDVCSIQYCPLRCADVIRWWAWVFINYYCRVLYPACLVSDNIIRLHFKKLICSSAISCISAAVFV